MSIRERIENTFPFTVDKLPAAVAHDDGTHTQSGQYFLARSDRPTEPRIVRGPSVSERYQPHTREDIVLLAEAAASAYPDHGGWGASVRCSWRYGHIIEIAPSKEHRYRAAVEDTVYPRIWIRGRYDQCSTEFQGGLYREMCKNLLMPQLVEGMRRKFQHVGPISDRMAELGDHLQAMAGQWQDLRQWVCDLSEQRHELGQFLRDVYGTPEENASPAKRTNWETRVSDIFRQLSKERQAQGRDLVLDNGRAMATGWEVFNLIQNWSQTRQRRAPGTDQLQRAIAASSDQYVRRAEQLLSTAV